MTNASPVPSGTDPADSGTGTKIPLLFCDRCPTITELARAIKRAPEMVQAFLRCAKKGGAWVGGLHDRLDRTTTEVVLEGTGFYAQWGRPPVKEKARLVQFGDFCVDLFEADGGRLGLTIERYPAHDGQPSIDIFVTPDLRVSGEGHQMQ